MFWVLVLALLALTRVPAASQYLSIDNVNLAFALENFDPRIHQPQPPGYPLFVLFARFVNVFFGDAELTFLFISIAASALCLPVIYALGRLMFDEWVGKAAVLLLVVNPVFWHSGIDGPLRPTLALFSLLIGYCAWRAWQGEHRFVLWGAVALGVGGGFRPDLLAYLAPVWLVSAIAGTRSVKTVLAGAAVLAGIVLVWVGGLVYAVGGAGELAELLRRYAIEQTRAESVVLGATLGGWLRQINRLVIWNGLAVIAWIWAVPLFLLSRERVGLVSRVSLFFFMWLVPGLFVQALIHVAAPGHVLFSIPVLCLIGAYVLGTALQGWRIADTALAAALIVNVLLFTNFVPLPPPGSPGGLGDALRVATFETSLESIRGVNGVHAASLQEIRDLTPPDRKAVIIALDVHVREWFLNWRIARYYFPDHDIRVLADQQQPPYALTVKGSASSEPHTGSPVEIRVPRGARILWLVGSDTPFRAALDSTMGLQRGQRLLYTDVAADTPSFQVKDFLFVPEDGI